MPEIAFDTRLTSALDVATRLGYLLAFESCLIVIHPSLTGYGSCVARPTLARSVRDNKARVWTIRMFGRCKHGLSQCRFSCRTVKISVLQRPIHIRLPLSHHQITRFRVGLCFFIPQIVLYDDGNDDDDKW